MGRKPSKDWATLAPAILESVKGGTPLGQTCRELGVSTQTLQKYRNRTPGYNEEMKAAIKASSNYVRNPEGKGGYPAAVSGNPEGTTHFERESRERTRHKGILAKEKAIDALHRLPEIAAKNLERLDAILDRLYTEWDEGELETKEFLAAKDRLQKDMDTLSKFVPNESFKQEERTTKDVTDPTTKFLSLPPQEREKLLEAARADLDEVARIKQERADAFEKFATIDVEAREIN